MGNWPNNPAAVLEVYNWADDYGTNALVRNYTTINAHIFTSPDIKWNIELWFTDSANFFHCGAEYHFYLYKKINGEYRKLDSTGGTHKIDKGGKVNSILKTQRMLSDTMDNDIEYYQLHLKADSIDYTGPGPNGHSGWTVIDYIAVKSYTGSFILDYLPISIVYCPPGQDMVASLRHGVDLETCMTIGNSRSSHSTETGHARVSFLGTEVVQGATTESVSEGNGTESGIKISYFRSSTIIADNRNAIGRAYWGPLGDIIVVAKANSFDFETRNDGHFLYQFAGLEKIIVAPVHKLLRPDGDDEILSMPDEVRRRLLELDPFILKSELHKFLPLDGSTPDPNIPLIDAVDPFADPSINNRAERIGTWYLKPGTSMEYAIGDRIELSRRETSQLDWESGVALTTGGGVSASIYGIQFGLGIHGTQNDRITTGYQSSKATIDGETFDASCKLIVNQNAVAEGGIALYYDKVFSSLIFRRIRSKGYVFEGVIYDIEGFFMDMVKVELLISKTTYETVTDHNGKFKFWVDKGDIDPIPDDYKIKVGDKVIQAKVHIQPNEIESTHFVCIKNVRRIIDLSKTPQWEIRKVLNGESYLANHLRKVVHNIFNLTDLRVALNYKLVDIKELKNRAIIKMPTSPLENIPGISRRDIEKLKFVRVNSIQALWRGAKRSDWLKKISKISGIDYAKLYKWVSDLEKSRISKRKR